MTKSRNLIVALLLLVLGAMLVAACGGDDDDSDGATAAATQDQSGSDATKDADGATDGASDPTDEPDNGGNGGGDASDACSLLTKEDVEGIFGVSMLEPELIPLPDVPVFEGVTAKVSSCSYVSADTSDSLSITLYSANDRGAEGLADLACANKDSAGVGDRSCWYSEAHTEIQMQVGGSFVDIFVTTVEGDSAEITTAVAEKAVDRLS